MKIVFVSNYYNHHQAPLSEEFYKQTNGEYTFIETSKMPEFRKAIGYEKLKVPPFLLTVNESDEQSKKKAKQLIAEADVVVYGSAPYKYVREIIQEGKLTFKYSERIYKNKKKLLELPLRFIKYTFCGGFRKNVFLLCSSAYASADYQRTMHYRNRALKWGYFPQLHRYENIEQLIELKRPASILWAARLIELKHPEAPIEIAKRLKKDGYAFDLKMIGNGELAKQLEEMIHNYGLDDCVHLMGAMKPDEVRNYMEQSRIFLFTSDFNEGWGAVLNEAMNSACAVVASHAIGSVPYLIDDEKNGFIYKNGDLEDLYQRVKYLMDNPVACDQIGKNAYQTLESTWNAKVAAERLLDFAERLLKEENTKSLYETGPCSKAEFLKNDWKSGK